MSPALPGRGKYTRPARRRRRRRALRAAETDDLVGCEAASTQRSGGQIGEPPRQLSSPGMPGGRALCQRQTKSQRVEARPLSYPGETQPDQPPAAPSFPPTPAWSCFSRRKLHCVRVPRTHAPPIWPPKLGRQADALGGLCARSRLPAPSAPCSRLLEILPVRLEGRPQHSNFPSHPARRSTTEGAYVGYRYHQNRPCPLPTFMVRPPKFLPGFVECSRPSSSPPRTGQTSSLMLTTDTWHENFSNIAHKCTIDCQCSLTVLPKGQLQGDGPDDLTTPEQMRR